MSDFVRNVLVNCAPVFGVCMSIAVLRAGGVPFPPELALAALPKWFIFGAVVYSCTAICMFFSKRLFGKPSNPANNNLSA